MDPGNEIPVHKTDSERVSAEQQAADPEVARAWALLERIQRERLIVLQGPRLTRDELYEDRIRLRPDGVT